jgi:multiple sugar transport system substrate-binding protein
MSHSKSRRALISLVAATALVTSMAACSPAATTGDSNGKPHGTIRALFMKQAAYSTDDIDNMTKAFEKANPGVQVKADFVSYDSLHDKIVTSAAAKVYDVILTDAIWPAEFASKGLVKNLTDEITPADKDAIFGGALKSAEYKKGYYGIPWILDTEYLFFNKSMLAKAGVTTPPKTWDEVTAAAHAIKDAGVAKYPFIWAGAQGEELVCAYGALLGAFGGTWLDDKGQPSFNTGGGVKALEYMKMTLDDGLADPASLTSSGDDVRKAISQGDVAMGIDWTYVYAMANDPKESAVAGQIGIAHTPSGPAGAPGINGSMALSVTSTSKNPATALAYVKYLTSQPVQNNYAALSLPIWQSSYAPGVTLKGVSPEVLDVAKTQLGDMLSRPEVPQYNAVSHALQVEIQNALTGAKTPQQALDDAASQASALLKH